MTTQNANLEDNKVKFSLRLKLIGAIIISLLISSPITAFINSVLEDLFKGNSFGVFINTLVTLVITTSIILIFSQYLLIKPLKKVLDVTRKTANGDLTSSLDIRSNDEIGELSSAYDQMVLNLKDLINHSNQSSAQIASNSEELKIGAEQGSIVAEQISNAIQEVVAGADAQTNSTIELNNLSKEIEVKMAQTITAIKSVVNVSNLAENQANEGNNIAAETIKQMDLVQQSVKETSSIIRLLGEKSQEINQIIDMITQIAKQTNLLALNAAIEASRAGEHGKGFAVVAEEVRELAEQSGESAKQIFDLVKEIQKAATDTVTSMDKGTESLDNGIEMVHKTGKAFENIVVNVQDVSTQTESVYDIIDQVKQNLNSMAGMIENIESVSYQTSASTQNVAAAAEEQAASMEEVLNSAAGLNEIAIQLQKINSRFKVK